MYYDTIYYYLKKETFIITNEHLGRWLTPTTNCDDATTY